VALILWKIDYKKINKIRDTASKLLSGLEDKFSKSTGQKEEVHVISFPESDRVSLNARVGEYVSHFYYYPIKNVISFYNK